MSISHWGIFPGYMTFASNRSVRDWDAPIWLPIPFDQQFR